MNDDSIDERISYGQIPKKYYERETKLMDAIIASNEGEGGSSGGQSNLE